MRSNVWPLSQGEIDGTPDGFVDAMFGQGVEFSLPACELTKHDYVARASRGGYSEAVRRDPGRRRSRFFDSYITDLVTRDVRQISDIERPAEMRRLLSVVAARMGTLAVVQSMVADHPVRPQTWKACWGPMPGPRSRVWSSLGRRPGTSHVTLMTTLPEA
jgi:predicted AAA+ superfamily ATPase